MKAVNYVGSRKVKVEEVEKPRLEQPDDIIIEATTVSSRFQQFGDSYGLKLCRLLFAAPIFSNVTLDNQWKNEYTHKMCNTYEGRTTAEPGITFGKIIYSKLGRAQILICQRPREHGHCG